MKKSKKSQKPGKNGTGNTAQAADGTSIVKKATLAERRAQKLVQRTLENIGWK